MTHRVAAIDCGTNSIRLLIADLTAEADHPERSRGSVSPAQPAPAGGPAGRPLTDVTRQMRIVRLGEGVDKTGRLSDAALDRTAGALREYAGLIAAARPEAVRMVATSATRDAGNSQEFTDRVKEVLGIVPEVVSGEEEAWLSFTGATRELAGTPLATTGGCPPPYLVTDIGGGSTEFVLGGVAVSRGDDPPMRARWQKPPSYRARGTGLPASEGGDSSHSAGIAGLCSVDVGCVRMTERHLHGDPPSAAEAAAAAADIDRALDQVAAVIPVGQARTLVGLAGSVTTVAGIALGLDRYDSARIHHARIPAAQVHQIAVGLFTMDRAERAAIGVMHPGRVDVIGAGALVLDRIMTRFGFAEVLVSEHDILDGIAWSLVS